MADYEGTNTEPVQPEVMGGYTDEEEWTSWSINVGLRLDRQDKKIYVAIAAGAGGILLGVLSLSALAKLAKGLAPVMAALQNAQSTSNGPGSPASDTGAASSSTPTSSQEPTVHEENHMHGPSMTPNGSNGTAPIDESRTPPEGSTVAPPVVHGAPPDVDLGADGEVDPLAELMLHEQVPRVDGEWIDNAEPTE